VKPTTAGIPWNSISRREEITSTTGPSAAHETAGTAGDTNSSKGARNNRNISSRRHVNNRRDAVNSSDGHNIWDFKAEALASVVDLHPDP
jgi:hypothetical protein